MAEPIGKFSMMPRATEPTVGLLAAEKIVQKEEVSPEPRKIAEQTIWWTMELGDDAPLENFPKKLAEAVKILPKYLEIKIKLDSVPAEAVGYALFQKLKRANDAPVADDTVPTDGVLISSMHSGKLECAGRTLLASTYLRERNIDHIVIQAAGHSFLMIEQGNNTLAYFDANNNLYFTLPREALSGYQGIDAVSECRLQAYTPREDDTVDGLNTPFTYFITIPSSEGVSRQYLGNVQAALAGNKEFRQSNIKPNHDASLAIDTVQQDLLGDGSPVLKNFLADSENSIAMTELQSQADRKIIGDLLKTNSEQENFAQEFAQVVQGDLGNRLVYLKNASRETRVAYGRRVWEFFQNPAITDEISRMQ